MYKVTATTQQVKYLLANLPLGWSLIHSVVYNSPLDGEFCISRRHFNPLTEAFIIASINFYLPSPLGEWEVTFEIHDHDGEGDNLAKVDRIEQDLLAVRYIESMLLRALSSLSVQDIEYRISQEARYNDGLKANLQRLGCI
jgi:hypothetical protein